MNRRTFIRDSALAGAATAGNGIRGDDEAAAVMQRPYRAPRDAELKTPLAS